MPAYYKFWITSSRGTDDMTVVMYPEPQPEYILKDDCEEWAKAHSAWGVSENVIHYGHEEIDMSKLPKTREGMIAHHSKAYHNKDFWARKAHLYASLLSHPPFNGKKV